jgi:hypothetical protein
MILRKTHQMNDRIKQLADQAGIHDDVCSMCPIHELEKFAELIIEECVSISNIERDNSVGCGYVTQTIGQRIRKHFGVEK